MTNKLSAANIKYLRAIYDIGNNKIPVKNVEISKKLNVSKPSVHTMLSVLCDLELIYKNKNGTISFTKTGAEITEKYNIVYNHLINKICDFEYVTNDNLNSVALTILSQIALNDVTAFVCKKL